MKKIAVILMILFVSFSLSGNIYATANSTQKSVQNRIPVKKNIFIGTQFTVGKIQYTINSINTFDKVGVDNGVSTYKYPKNGQFIIIGLTYKNLGKNDASTGNIKIISSEKIFTRDVTAEVYGKYQMGSDDYLNNIASYIPTGTKADLYVGFDVPSDAISKGMLYIDGGIVNSSVRIQIPISNFKKAAIKKNITQTGGTYTGTTSNIKSKAILELENNYIYDVLEKDDYYDDLIMNSSIDPKERVYLYKITDHETRLSLAQYVGYKIQVNMYEIAQVNTTVASKYKYAFDTEKYNKAKSEVSRIETIDNPQLKTCIKQWNQIQDMQNKFIWGFIR